MTVQDTYCSKKQENWPRLGILFEKGCVLHKPQYGDSGISYVSVRLSLPTFSLVLHTRYFGRRPVLLLLQLYRTRYLVRINSAEGKLIFSERVFFVPT